VNTSSSASTHTTYIIFVSCIATIGGFLFGFDSGVINGTVDGLQVAFNSDSVGTGFNVASMLLGCAIGAYFAGRLADRFGRRAIMRVAAAFFLLSAWGSGVATGSLEFVIYRVLGGLAVGAASVPRASLYQRSSAGTISWCPHDGAADRDYQWPVHCLL